MDRTASYEEYKTIVSFIIRTRKNVARESLFVTRSIQVMTNNVSEGPVFFSHLPMLKRY